MDSFPHDTDEINYASDPELPPRGSHAEDREKFFRYLERYQTASSVVIPREVFESTYLTPYIPKVGHLRSTFANPTPV